MFKQITGDQLVLFIESGRIVDTEDQGDLILHRLESGRLLIDPAGMDGALVESAESIPPLLRMVSLI